MSGKLDQSLDEILSTTKRVPRNGRARRPAQAGKPAAAATPVGGVSKANNNRGARGNKHTNAKPAPTGPALLGGTGKIMVSNLPKDVNEAQIKEYFTGVIGPIKKVDLSYGPNGQSRGVASVIYSRTDRAASAIKTLNGLLVDGKPMRVEVIVDATNASALAAPKGLSERVAQPKNQKQQPKSAAAKPKVAAKAGNANARGKPRNSRPARKTAEELDSEMADYFEAGTGAAAPAVAAAAPATEAMDEIL